MNQRRELPLPIEVKQEIPPLPCKAERRGALGLLKEGIGGGDVKFLPPYKIPLGFQGQEEEYSFSTKREEPPERGTSNLFLVPRRLDTTLQGHSWKGYERIRSLLRGRGLSGHSNPHTWHRGGVFC